MNQRTIALLAFLAITVLTALAVLAAAVGWLPHAEPKLVSWGIPSVLGEIVATVVIYLKSPIEVIRVNLAFEGAPATGVDLSHSGTYRVLDNSGKELKAGTLVPILGPGGYQVTLPPALDPASCISLSFTERQGAQWSVRPFLPYVQTQAAARSSAMRGAQ
jgi:hypothetical protein